MKKATSIGSMEPTVRILLVAPHLYQVCFRNIYGYLKAILIDRCKKVGATYRHFQKSYFLDSDNLILLKKEFEDVLQMKNSDSQMKFRIEDFPMTNIKMMLKQDKSEQKVKEKNRIIFIDKLSENRYFYTRKKFEQYLGNLSKEHLSRENKNWLIITSAINKKIWTSLILQVKKPSNAPNSVKIETQTPCLPTIVDLTYSELTSKKSGQSIKKPLGSLNQQKEQSKIFLLTYDNIKFVEGSWFLSEMKHMESIITDDGQFLISGQSQIATLQNKNRNFEAYRLLLRNYQTSNELIVFLSKIPEPVDLIKLLILVKPKNFCGVKFSQSFTNQLCFQGFKTQEEKHNHDEFISWFKKRYKTENKCFKEIYYLLTNSVVKNLDDSVFKKTVGLLPSLEMSNQDNLNKIVLLETSSQIVEKFRSMDKKYKKLYPQINFKQILQDLHNSQKIHERRFQVASKIDDHLLSKHSRNYLSEAKEVMLSSKIQLILQRLYFTINSQKQRIVVIVQDQKLQKRIKKYFKETQIDYVDYEVTKTKPLSNSISNISVNYLCSTEGFTAFDSSYSIKACIFNSSKCFKQFTELNKKRMQKTKRQYQNQHLEQDYLEHYDIKIETKLKVPLITTAESIHYIDSFWNEFNFEKQSFISSVFNFSLSFVTDKKVQSNFCFEEEYKKPRIPQVYYVFQGSYEKMMLEKLLSSKKNVEQVKIQDNLQQKSKLEDFIDNLIVSSNHKLQNLNCPVIKYLDIDEEYDKIDEQAKQVKKSCKQSIVQEKVFLPKYANPQIKSFKEMIKQTLNEKSIQEILDNSNDVICEDQIIQKTQQSLTQPSKRLDNSKNQFKSYIKGANIDQKENNEDQDEIRTLEDSFQNQGQKVRIQQQLKPFDIQVQTIRLSSQRNELQYLLLTPDNQTDKSSKDLFDQLLGSNFEQQYAGLTQHESINPKLQEKRQPEVEEQLHQTQLQKYLIEPNNSKIQQNPEIKDPSSLLLQNFGAMAYNQKYGISSKKSWSKNIHEQIKQKQKPQRDQDLIEINQNEGNVIDLESLPQVPRNVVNPLRRNDKSNKISQRQNRNFYELPKQKKMCSKKLYEEAISKSKQLWEKKLRKEKELLIIGTKQLEFNLTPKEGWKESLTSEEIAKLKEKGIRFED